MIIGLYGKSGSGKTTACVFFEKKGFFIVNADKIGHEVLTKELITEAFGEEYVDRKKLGKLVFSDKAELNKLNSITKPLIEDRIISLIKEHENTVVDGAILQNTKIVDYCDITVLIRSKNILERIMKRDNLTEIDALNRINSQIISEKADIIIDNDESIDELYIKLNEVIKHGKKTSI